ncbi:MAG: DUF1549 domain-containing protein, partial [Chthoniobacteraceae bacterium]|nr:DUF1549 domain-containing protein [Chthoniobacteraceae bacterium]
MRRYPLVLLALLGLSPAVRGADAVQFSRDILPLLSENCLSCHGQDESHRKGELRLDLREAAVLKKAVVPGNPAESELIKRIVTTDVDEVMPPPKSHKAPLTQEQVDILKRWIAEGAVWGKHWAFELPRKGSTEGHPVDYFVRKKLQARSLQPSPEASKHTLLRRLSFDLTGLPPTLEETDAFLNDSSPEAVQTVVRRLLASKHYGERMAMWWLDAAR